MQVSLSGLTLGPLQAEGAEREVKAAELVPRGGAFGVTLECRWQRELSELALELNFLGKTRKPVAACDRTGPDTVPTVQTQN